MENNQQVMNNQMDSGAQKPKLNFNNKFNQIRGIVIAIVSVVGLVFVAMAILNTSEWTVVSDVTSDTFIPAITAGPYTSVSTTSDGTVKYTTDGNVQVLVYFYSDGTVDKYVYQDGVYTNYVNGVVYETSSDEIKSAFDASINADTEMLKFYSDNDSLNVEESTVDNVITLSYEVKYDDLTTLQEVTTYDETSKTLTVTNSDITSVYTLTYDASLINA